MNWTAANRYGLPLTTQQKSRMQRLRYEQKTEGQRLDTIKKVWMRNIRAFNSCSNNCSNVSGVFNNCNRK
jgi:hypothetical protein